MRQMSTFCKSALYITLYQLGGEEVDTTALYTQTNLQVSKSIERPSYLDSSCTLPTAANTGHICAIINKFIQMAAASLDS